MRQSSTRKSVTAKNLCRRLLPDYGWIPLLTVLTVNILAYNGTRLLPHLCDARNLENALDNRIPVVPAFVIIYVLAYVQWVFGYWAAARAEKSICYRMCAGEVIGKIITMCIYLLIPTTLTRPELTGSDPLTALLRLIYAIDPPDNLLPSMHCFASWFCFRVALKQKNAPSWYAPAQLGFTLVVFLSTVLVKQHVLIDVISGVAVMEAGLLLARLTRAERVFEWAEAKIKNRKTRGK